MIHGTFYAYTNGGCRCVSCTEANRDHSLHYRPSPDRHLTQEQRRHCLICGTALSVHPLRACWREVR